MLSIQILLCIYEVNGIPIPIYVNKEDTTGRSYLIPGKQLTQLLQVENNNETHLTSLVYQDDTEYDEDERDGQKVFELAF